MAMPFDKLRRIEGQGVKELLAVVKKAQANAKRVVADAASSPAAAQDARARERVYAEIIKEYEGATKPMDTILKRVITQAGKVGNQAAGVSAPEGVDVLQFNEARLARYWAYVAPENSKSLAATMTESMSENAVKALRTAFVDNFRQAGVEGWTAQETQKRLQDKWNELSGDAGTFRFVDRSGKTWENARYLQMVTRTNANKVSRESYIDSLTEAGLQFAKISDDSPLIEGEVCSEWAGRIVTIAGSYPGVPSYQDALDAGVFHPNCLHRLQIPTDAELKAAGIEVE